MSLDGIIITGPNKGKHKDEVDGKKDGDVEESVDNPGDDDGDAIDQDMKKKVKEEKDDDPDYKNKDGKVDADLDKDGDGDHDKDDHEAEVKEGKINPTPPEKANIPGPDGKIHSGKETEANAKQRPPEEKGRNLPKDKGGDPENPPSWGEETEEDENALEEEFKSKAQVIFETAVNEKVSNIREELEEDYKALLDESLQTVNERVEEYLDYAVQTWIAENSLEIKYSLRTEIAENFIRGLRGLFEESYIDIPEEQIDVVDELTEVSESYKDQIAELTDALAEANSTVLNLTKTAVINEMAEDLTQTQAIKLHSLAEHVEADSVEEFEHKLAQLKEANFIDVQSNSYTSLTEEVIYDDGSVVEEDGNSAMSMYTNFLGKTVR